MMLKTKAYLVPLTQPSEGAFGAGRDVFALRVTEKPQSRGVR